ncbi:hypothetical protein HMN09_00288600 [Mycena chlorophos]|uniref:CxC2-like cysteine cluster KDZ transposase-associated domain-containing protein n=1 Tax=Mycena chlorophos TaxID=658473 RepID=A0A8H6TMM8_MYCCL|nr:hypothetical protein HMN09_00288600 [Mycena chlorophos]
MAAKIRAAANKARKANAALSSVRQEIYMDELFQPESPDFFLDQTTHVSSSSRRKQMDATPIEIPSPMKKRARRRSISVIDTSVFSLQDDYYEMDFEAVDEAQVVKEKVFRPSDPALQDWTQQHRNQFLRTLLWHDGRGVEGTQLGALCTRCNVEGRAALYRCDDCLCQRLLCKECCVEAHGQLPFHAIQMVVTFEADRTRKNPYLAEMKGKTEAQVRLELQKREEEQEKQGRAQLRVHDVGPVGFLEFALAVERQQRRVKAQAALKKSRSTAQQINLGSARRKLNRDQQTLRTLQATFTPDALAKLNALALPETTIAEDVPLLLPSALATSWTASADPVAGLDPTRSELLSMEREIRSAQMGYALAYLRNHLHIRKRLRLNKELHVRHQAANTRAMTAYARNESQVSFFADLYQVAWFAILQIEGGDESKVGFSRLRREDIRYMDDPEVFSKKKEKARERDERLARRREQIRQEEGWSEDENQLELDEREDAEDPDEFFMKPSNTNVMSWIWRGTQAGGNEAAMAEAVRIEWCKAWARERRWTEEVDILEDETRRVLVSHEDWAADWEKRARRVPIGEIPESEAEGMVAYALKQAAIHRKLAKLRKRVTDILDEAGVPYSLEGYDIQFGLPVWHAAAHEVTCQMTNSLSYAVGVGRTDGEGIERLWAMLNPISFATKEMGEGNRHDAIEDKIDHLNFEKNIREGDVLARKLLIAVDKTLTSALRQEWQTRVTEWLADKSKPNPYTMDGGAEAGPSESKVAADLKEAEVAEARLQRGIGGPDTPTWHEVKNTQTLTAERSSQLEELRASFYKKLNAIEQQQSVYMAGVAVLRDSAEEREQAARQQRAKRAEREPPPPRRRIRLRGLFDVEAKLRRAQCGDALNKIRSLLFAKTHLIYQRNANATGQYASTRSSTLIGRVTDKITREWRKYQQSYSALLRLKGADYAPELQPLLQEDLNVRAEAETDDQARTRLGRVGSRPLRNEPARNEPTAKEARPVSWIWMAGPSDAKIRMHQSVRVQWSKRGRVGIGGGRKYACCGKR